MLNCIDFHLRSDSVTQVLVSASAVALLVLLLNLHLVLNKSVFSWNVSMMSAKELLGHLV
jgi:hypothetical protein